MCKGVVRVVEGHSFNHRRCSPWTAGFFCLLCSLLVPWLSGCASVAPVVKIGLVGPFEGKYRDIGYDTIYSARLAVRQINARGGIGGHRLALVALDDGGDPKLAEAVATSLIIDPAVVAVVGHWIQPTTSVASPIYSSAGLPFILTGEVPFSAIDPALLPLDFKDAYQKITPYDESAGPYSAAAYDAFQLLAMAIERVAERQGIIDRESVAMELAGLEYQGLTGLVYQP